MTLEWNEPYAHSEPMMISSRQRVVTSPHRFYPGSGDLTVYYNGLYAVLGVDYKEITPYSIEFLYDLEIDDTVVFHYQKLW